MQYDREITISTAGSRKAADWKPQRLRWSEFCERLRVPVRSSETITAYLAMKKAQQDELKDVGGFVGGRLCGRRKKGAVEFRDLVTLDMDSLPPGGAEEVLRRAEGLGMGYAVYSTRKHRPDAPRLRLCVPLDRGALPDEYAPIARKLAQLIQPEMTWFDPTTFQPERLMYWPSVCAGGEYLFQFADKPFLSAGGMLGLYANWQDAAGWPVVPGETRLRAQAAKRQGDPAEKGGVVGAFCRTYDIEAAMHKFIPEAYAETAQPGRYTYTGGSTAGGAVLYDDGKFLYSHHATDPCGGQLVNAFDLVRLHKFAGLDDDAKEGTPVGRLPSYDEMCRLARSDPAVSDLLAQEAFAAAVDDFGEVSDQDAALGLGRCEKEPLTVEIVRLALRAFGIRIRRNQITGKAEIDGMPAQYSREEAVNTLPVFLLDKLRAVGVKGVNKAAVTDYLANLADEGRFNPVLDMLHGTAWDGVTRLPVLLRLLGLGEGSLHAALVRKWLIQTVALAHNETGRTQAAEGVLTMQGGQGIGKTMLFRRLALRDDWFAEGVSLDMKNKDDILRATGAWITELGELDSTLKREQSSLKAFITAKVDRVRAPYAREATDRPRRASFCATVNPDTFLRDETGDRRFWVVPAGGIDLDTLLDLPDVWFAQLWAEALCWWQAEPQGFRLSLEERQALDRANRPYREQLPCEEELRQLLDWELPPEEWGWFTASDLRLRMFGCGNATAAQIGRVLAKLEREDDRVKRKTKDGYRRFWLPVKGAGSIT